MKEKTADFDLERDSPLHPVEILLIAVVVGATYRSWQIFFLSYLSVIILCALRPLRVPLATAATLFWVIAFAGKVLEACLAEKWHPVSTILLTAIVGFGVFNYGMSRRVGLGGSQFFALTATQVRRLFHSVGSLFRSSESSSNQSRANANTTRETNSGSERTSRDGGYSDKSDTYGNNESIKTTNMFDPYTILSVPKHSSKNEITKAYRELVHKYHPDKIASLAPEFQELAHRKMVDINRAYDTLMA